MAKLLARCNKQWADAWVVGAFVAGDEAIAPHKGKGPMRMFIPQKPHATGVKLYVLADSTAPYVVDMYMYQGKCPIRGVRKYGCVGRYTSREVVNHWGQQVPRNTTLVCDSFFRSHRTADSLANRKVGYLFLMPKDTKGVSEAGARLPEGRYRVGHLKRARCSLYVFKAPKVVTRQAAWCHF